jgi:hypothetical protein
MTMENKVAEQGERPIFQPRVGGNRPAPSRVTENRSRTTRVKRFREPSRNSEQQTLSYPFFWQQTFVLVTLPRIPKTRTNASRVRRVTHLLSWSD